MRAARLHEFNKPLQIDEVPIPSPRKGEEVLVRVGAAGICHSDLSLVAGLNKLVRLPITLGHEISGRIEEVSRDVRSDLSVGDDVAVYAGWGCGRCRFCEAGEYQLCNTMLWGGVGSDGGFAEFIRVPSHRYLVRLHGLDMLQAATLTDAGLTPFHAIKKTLPFLYPGAMVVIIGVGGLGHAAVQLAKAVSPSTSVIAVDLEDDRLEYASKLGADHVLKSDAKLESEIKRLTNGEGAQAIIDIVGTDSTLQSAARSVGRKGIVVVVGLGGGTLRFSTSIVPPECTIVRSSWGTLPDLVELMELARAGKVKISVERFRLEEVNLALDLLRNGRIRGRGALVP